MAPRRKKGKGSAAPRPPARKDAPPASAMEEALRKAGIAPDAGRGKRKDTRTGPQPRTPGTTADPAPPSEPAPPVTPSKPRTLSPEEAMAAAFEAIDDKAIHNAKFHGGGADPFSPDTRILDQPDDEPPPEPDPDDDLTQDDLLFVEAMGTDVRRMEHATARIREHAFTGLRWHSAHQLDTLSATDLHEPTLDGTQRDLLKRSRRNRDPMPVLNVRHQRRREALGEIEAFVSHHRREAHRFVRIVTGKGRQSRDGEPVLKPALLTWCTTTGQDHVLGWAPETDQSGRYGSIVLELRPWHRSKT